jgi:photosystem II stability/assembly factor-like uncharacterized protein
MALTHREDKVSTRVLRAIAVIVLIGTLVTGFPAVATPGVPARNATIGCPLYFSDDLVLVYKEGHLYKATDEGWRELSPPEQLGQLQVMPGGEIYGVGGSTGRPIYRSADRGETWEHVGQFLEFADLFFPSPMPDVFFAGVRYDWPFYPGSPAGIYRSTDAGATWERVLGEWSGGHDMAFSPQFADDHIAFASLSQYHSASGVWVTEDGGETWDMTSVPSGDDLAGHFLAVSPQFSQDRTVFAVAGFGLYKSTDAGTSWSEVLSGYDSFMSLMPHVPVLSQDYARDQTLLLWSYDTGLHLSQDGGESWQTIYVSGYEHGRYVCGGGVRHPGPFEPLAPPLPGPYHIYLPLVSRYTEPQLEIWVMVESMSPPSYSLFRSRNYGATWEEVPVFEANSWLYLPLIASGLTGILPIAQTSVSVN